MNQEKQQMKIAIIGAGISGLCMAIQLKKNNISSFKIFEKAENLGGTWQRNTYPGAGCDVPSLLYSFSFEPKNNWQQTFAEQPEILQYLEDCADKYDVREHIQFNTEIVETKFDSEQNVWDIYTRLEEHFQANIVIFACGQFNTAKIPEIPGLNTFKGTQFHSSHWNHQHQLDGKNIAVIGNGASAIQFIPKIAEQAHKLIIFQRSPNWILKKENRIFSALEKMIFKKIPQMMKLYRWWYFLVFESRLIFLLKDSIFAKIFTLLLEKYLEKEVKQDELKSILKPKYEPGCKRVLLSDNYYKTLDKSHVELITSPIKSINDNQITTEDQQKYLVDTLIFATGFKVSNFLPSIKITGLENQSLKKVWQNGAEAYKGMMVSGFPNLFMLYGPNTNLGHNSIILMVESQVKYVLSCMKLMDENQLKYLDVKNNVQSKFNQKLQVQLSKTVWNSNCTSWYKTDKGKIVTNWPGFIFEYWRVCRQANLEHFNFRKEEESRTHLLKREIEIKT